MIEQPTAIGALICPPPHPAADRIQLGHGSGGKLSAALSFAFVWGLGLAAKPAREVA